MYSENAPTPSFTLFRVLDETAQALGFESTHNPPALCQAMSRAEEIANEVGVPTRASVAHSNSRGDLSSRFALLKKGGLSKKTGRPPRDFLATCLGF